MTNAKLLRLLCATSILFCFATTARAQVSSLNPSAPGINPWTQDQLLAPATLGEQLKANKPHALILNIGKVEDIKNAKHIGAANQKENLDKLTKEVSPLPRNTELIIYCGCCPLATKCPNVRPAFLELKRLGFTNIRVLNLPTNLQTDWISKGYPLAEK
ncbi:MAG: rhodanese-like domain-containing protein [Bacteroidetes bacterium]|nr:rhodanese-like domain-containing protein [Bacteroidota bacterium]